MFVVDYNKVRVDMVMVMMVVQTDVVTRTVNGVVTTSFVGGGVVCTASQSSR